MSKFNLSESEKNRILGLHEPKKNKSVSIITERSMIDEQFNIRRQVEPWTDKESGMPAPCLEALQLIFPNLGDDEEVGINAWNQSFRSNVTNGSWGLEAFYEEMCDVDGRNVCDICEESITDRGGKYGCGEKCSQRPGDVPVGRMVTAVISYYFDGKTCRMLSYGGGPFYSKSECEACCGSTSRTTDEELILINYPDIPQQGYDCVTREDNLTPVPKARCKFGEKLPIGNRTEGDYITIEDCCKLGGDRFDDWIEIDIEDDVEGESDAPRQRKKCNWKENHKDVPTGRRRETYLMLCIKGEKVEMVQEKLKEVVDCNLGKTGPDGDGVDGKFGRKTHRCVKEYQEKFDLRVDGIVGPETWNHMFPEGVEDVEGIEDVVIDDVPGGEEIFTQEEAIEVIEDIKGSKPDKKTCRNLIIATSETIKGTPNEIENLKADVALNKTLGYCFNMHNFFFRKNHGSRVRNTLGLDKKNNPV